MNNVKPVKLVIADPSEIVRSGLIKMLSDAGRFEIMALAENGKELVEAVRTHRPHVAITEVTMPLMSGIEATRKIKEEFPQVKIIALSGHDRVDYIQYMKQAGASGYLAKNASAEVLVKAIDAVLLNKEYCCHETLGKLVVNYHVRMKYRDELTVREIEVMVHIAQDLEADEIAERMFISPRTVEKHRQSLFKKLGAKTIAGIALYAERNGYLV